ncbi:hypothetical protein Hanom_Chr06g00523841 [Helianthus anomalus]
MLYIGSTPSIRVPVVPYGAWGENTATTSSDHRDTTTNGDIGGSRPSWQQQTHTPICLTTLSDMVDQLRTNALPTEQSKGEFTILPRHGIPGVFRCIMTGTCYLGSWSGHGSRYVET